MALYKRSLFSIVMLRVSTHKLCIFRGICLDHRYFFQVWCWSMWIGRYLTSSFCGWGFPFSVTLGYFCFLRVKVICPDFSVLAFVRLSFNHFSILFRCIWRKYDARLESLWEANVAISVFLVIGKSEECNIYIYIFDLWSQTLSKACEMSTNVALYRIAYILVRS